MRSIEIRFYINKLNSYGLNPQLEFEQYIVLRETPQTYLVHEVFLPWLTEGDFYNPEDYAYAVDPKRFYKTAKNRFAWETKEAAMADFARKYRWRRERLMQELEECSAAIRKAETYTHGRDKNNVF
jgi:hypothetical protein